MHRIDSVNARPNQNGVGKNGFNDNTDVSGMDATYQTPEWCNAIQEELANIIEAAGIALNKSQNNQLLAGIRNLFQTYTDGEIDALTTAMTAALAGEAATRAANDTSEATTRAGAISGLLLKIGGVGATDLQTQIDNLSDAISAIYPKIIAAGFETMTLANVSGWTGTKTVSNAAYGGVDLTNTAKYILQFTLLACGSAVADDITNKWSCSRTADDFTVVQHLNTDNPSMEDGTFTFTWSVVQLTA